MVDRKEDELPKTYLWDFRQATTYDHNMVYSSWLQSNRNAALYALVPNTVYFHEFHKIIESILEKGAVFVACDKEDPDQIFGYVVTEYSDIDDTLVVHWIYVKHPFRNNGVAQSLMTHVKEVHQANEVLYSTKTRRSGLIWDCNYSPFKLFKHVY